MSLTRFQNLSNFKSFHQENLLVKRLWLWTAYAQLMCAAQKIVISLSWIKVIMTKCYARSNSKTRIRLSHSCKKYLFLRCGAAECSWIFLTTSASNSIRWGMSYLRKVKTVITLLLLNRETLNFVKEYLIQLKTLKIYYNWWLDSWLSQSSNQTIIPQRIHLIYRKIP